MNFKGIGSLSPAKRILLFLVLGLVALFVPGFIDEVLLALWGIAQLVGVDKATRGVVQPKEKKKE